MKNIKNLTKNRSAWNDESKVEHLGQPQVLQQREKGEEVRKKAACILFHGRSKLR